MSDWLNANWWIIPLLISFVFFFVAMKTDILPKYTCTMLIVGAVFFFCAISGIFLTDKFTDLGTANAINFVLAGLGLLFMVVSMRWYLKGQKDAQTYLFGIIGIVLFLSAVAFDYWNIEFTATQGGEAIVQALVGA